MKAVFVFFSSFFVLSFASVQAQVATNVSLTSLKATDSTVAKSLGNYRKEIQDLILSQDKGVIRGIDFGTNIAKVREVEKAKFITEGKEFAIFKVSLNETDNAEVIYYLDDKRNIKGFGIEFLIKEEEFVLENNLILDFQQYFTDRYGDFKVNSRHDEVWDAGTHWIELRDASEGNAAMEIEIEMFPK
jgi:hypothetical protein